MLRLLTIDEGVLDLDTFTGRTWEVAVAPAADARKEAQQDRANRKAEDQEKREGEHRERVLAVLKRKPHGDTARSLRDATGLNAANFSRAVGVLIQEGRAAECEIVKNGHTYEGYKPTGK